MIAPGSFSAMFDRIISNAKPGEKYAYATINRTDREIRMIAERIKRMCKLRGYKPRIFPGNIVKVEITPGKAFSIRIVNTETKEIRK